MCKIKNLQKIFFIFLFVFIFVSLFNNVSAEWYDDWNQQTSSFDATLIYDSMTNGTTWVAVGESGKLATATDPTGTWTQRTSSFGTTGIKSIATDGTTWVIGGFNGKLATATDPKGTWTQRTSSFDTSHIYRVMKDEITWIAVGSNGKLATATDPTGTWTQRTSSFGNSDIKSIATDGTTWVIGGSNGKLATATDPTGTWTQRTSSFGTSEIYCIATDGIIWVAVGEGGKLATATDPTGTWTQRTSSFGTSEIYCIATDGIIWVAVGGGGKLATATNPKGTWTQRTSSFGSSVIRGVTTDETTWVAVGADGKLATAEEPPSRSIFNPSENPLYTFKEYDWNLGYQDIDYNSDCTYKYTFGFDTDSNLENGVLSTLINDQNLLITDTNLDYYDISYKPTTDDINDNIYSWIRINKYISGIYDSNIELSSSSDFNIIYNINHNLTNPSPPVYIYKDYNFDYNIQDYSYDLNKTYKYDFGINTSKSLSGATEYKSSLDLNIDSNSIKTFYITQDINEDYVNLDLYSYITLYTYNNSSLIDTNTIWSNSTFKPLYNLDVNIDHPDYPDFANRLYPCRLFDWNVTISDKSYDNNASYKYDFGFNDTNTINGNQTQTINDQDINIISDITERHFVASEIPESWLDSNIYAYITIYDYDNNNLIETKTYWTSDTAHINFGIFKLKVYDEDTITPLDNYVKIFDSTNDTTYTADVNGLFEYDINSLNCGYNDANIFRLTSEGKTHPNRQLDMILNRSSSIDGNMYLLSNTEGSNIEYLVKNTDNTLWNNKYLLFRNNSENYVSIYNSYLINDYTTSATKSTENGIVIKPNLDVYLTSINLKLNTSNPATQFYVFDKNIDAVVYQGTIPSDTTNVGIPYYNKLKLLQTHIYSIVVDNVGDNYKSYRSNNYLTSDINTTNVDYIGGASSFTTTDNDAYNILSINTVSVNKLDFAESKPIILWAKTDSDGKFTGYVKQDGNYTVFLYDEYGVLQGIYDKVKVTIKKPLDEVTLESISPYDVRVGGLLNYNLLNKTDANVSFNVFGGTVDYYSVQVVDYNAITTNRKYIPRPYLFNIPYGSSYTTTYTIQPYLLLINDGITPTIYVYDKLKRTIQGIVVEIYKSISGSVQLVQSSQTTSMGRTSFAAYPFDYYTIKLYYKNSLAGIYTVQPRSSSDNYYFLINTIADEPSVVGIDNSVDWSNTDSNINLSTTNPSAIIDISVSSPVGTPILTEYEIGAYQNGILVTTKNDDLSGSSSTINTVFDKSLFDSLKPTITYKLDYNYIYNSEVYTYSSVYTVNVISSNSNNIFSKLKSVPSIIGGIWALILGLLIIVSILAFITFTGFVTNGRAITILGIFLLGIFLFLGWLNVMGNAIAIFLYVLIVIFSLLLMLKGESR